MDPSGNSLFSQILTVLILTAINAFFAASEMAFVSLNRKKIDTLVEEGNKRAVKVQALLDKSEDFLATIQVAITLAGFLSSASAATSFAKYIARWIPQFPGVNTLAIVLVTILLSYITLVFGELFPKQVALQMPEKIAMWTAGTIQFVQTIFKPFVSLLSASTGLLRSVTPIDFSKEEEKYTRDEMRAILAESRLEGTIDATELTMLEGVLSLDSKLAREVMVPRTDTQMVDIEDSKEDILNTLLSSPFSRIPLYETEKDNVIGVIHMKNVMKAAREVGFDNIEFREIASEPLFVPSTIYIDDLLVEFKREQTHMAILRDEYGGVEGIVTLEDLLEEIVGEIEDETDTGNAGDIRKIDDQNYYINGGLSIDKFNNYFNQSLSDEEVDTIAGSIIYEIGYVPEDDEKVSVRANEYVLTTSHVENGRIRGVLVQLDPDFTVETLYNLYDEETEAYVPMKEVLEELSD
ncbi:hemolysin [Globicatella sp. HMSC072A10]|uniref:hemolysin family protein n=1 Tax=Globicatella sp. HMSC072A10 TaxID=1739315 RepID=UPI0008CE990A|nr:hemolysin family protein [Globicatella sp. HMSC072A10]OFK59549.1 hemolysin [Globicatella sp. HMSC072A10]